MSIASKAGKVAGYISHYAKKIPTRKIARKIDKHASPYLFGKPGGPRAYIGTEAEIKRIKEAEEREAKKKFLFKRFFNKSPKGRKKSKSRKHKKVTRNKKSYYKSKAWMAKIRKMRGG